MLFSSDLVASLTPKPPVMSLQKGGTATGRNPDYHSLSIKGSDLAFVNSDGQWVLEQGDFRMQCGNQVMTITYK